MSQKNPDQCSDALLLQQVEEGSAHAFDLLFERYWQKAYSDAYKRLKNHDDAKDIVQEIFTHIWVNRETIQIQNFPAYLHVAVRNKVIKMVSSRKVTYPFFGLLEDIPKETSCADSNLLWKEFLQSYESLVNSLPPKRQQIFRLRYEENIPTNAIAHYLSITRKTVQNQLGKAIDTLRTSILHILSILIVILYWL